MLLLFGAATIVAAFPHQQAGTVPAEKKRAMNKFDPTDLFPEAREHGRKERTKREKTSSPPSRPTGILVGSTSAGPTESTSTSRKNSRHRRSETKQPATAETRLAANAVPAPTPVLIAPATSPSLAAIQTQPTPVATVEQSPSPSAVMGGSAAMTTPPTQTLIASGNSTAAAADTSARKQPSQDSWLSLPVILTLLSLVGLALIFALVKLTKQFRGSVN